MSSNHGTIKAMRLEKVYIHHLIRGLQFAIPFVLLALMGVPVWNYLDRIAEEPVQEEVLPKLVKNMEALQEGFVFSQTVGQRTSFTIKAKTTLGFTDGRNILEDVSVTIFGEGENPNRLIHSDRGGYDEATKNIYFEGNVEFELDDETIGQSTELTYNHETRRVESGGPVFLRRPAEFEMRADSFVLLIPDSMVLLNGSVKVLLEDGSSLQTASARFHERDGWVQVSGGVEITTDQGIINGEEASAEFLEETLRVSSLIIAGRVHAESVDLEQDWVLDADAMYFSLSPQGAMEGVSARGTVSLRSGDQQDSQSLFGDRIDGVFDQEGNIAGVEATGDARMVLGPDKELRSVRILNERSGKLMTFADSFLRLGHAQLRGQDFEIERGDVVRFRTARRASLKTDSALSTADRTEASFDPENGELIELIQTGDIRFSQGARSGTAGRLEVSLSGNKILLSGRPLVSDDLFSVEADAIVFDQTKEFFTATGNAKMLSLDSTDPILIIAGQAEGNADKIVYSDSVELWRDGFHVRGQEIEIFQVERRLVAVGNVESTIQELRADSDRLGFDEAIGLVHYEGNVHVQSGEMLLDADDVEATLMDGEPQRVVATESVVITGPDFLVKADKGIYSRSLQTITLYGRDAEVFDSTTGKVQGRKLLMNIEDKGVLVNGEDGSRVFSRRFIGSN